MGRPKKYENDSERQAAYRARHPRYEVAFNNAETKATIEDIAAALDVSMNDAINSMLKFALTNRDWKRLGLTRTKK